MSTQEIPPRLPPDRGAIVNARTPGPWRVEPTNHGFDVSIGATNPVSGNPVWVGRVYGPASINGRHVETRDANAAFIVLACNAHDTLTADNALLKERNERLLGMIEEVCISDEQLRPEYRMPECLRDKLESALAGK